MKILIDNSHGRETPGKRSPDGRLLEYAPNRLLARGIVDGLTARGLDATLLVPDPTDIPLPERCRRVNEWCRQMGKDNVLLISIHCNAAGRGNRWLSARGWCAYTTRGNTRADALATSLYTAAQAHLPLHRRPGPPPWPSPPHRLHRRRPRPGSRLLPPPPHCPSRARGTTPWLRLF